MAWNKEFERAFHPKSVAIIGGRGGFGFGGRGGFIGAYRHLGFEGAIYPINPRHETVEGLPCYSSLADLPETPDFVIVSVPAPAVPQALRDCADIGALNVHVFTAGFEETGLPERIELGKEVRRIAWERGIRMVGPNGMGLHVPAGRIGPWPGMYANSGHLAVISQSGGNLNHLTHYAPPLGIYFSKTVSMGNAYVLDEVDFLEYFETDDESHVVALYLEGTRRGDALLERVRGMSRRKPVLLWKSGVTADGSRAAASHTGALAGQNAIWDAFYTQSGAIRVHSVLEWADVGKAFLWCRPPRGRRVAIVGTGGGISVATTDLAALAGLEVPPLSEATQEALRQWVPIAGSSLRNPLDAGNIIRSPEIFGQALRIIAADPAIDIVLLMPHVDNLAARSDQSIGGNIETIRAVIDVAVQVAEDDRLDKTVAMVFVDWMNLATDLLPRYELTAEAQWRGIPVYDSQERACRALACLCEYYLDGGRDPRR